jgi:hypothetical protein
VGFAFIGAIILATHTNMLAMNIGIFIAIIGIILSIYTMDIFIKVITAFRKS